MWNIKAMDNDSGAQWPDGRPLDYLHSWLIDIVIYILHP
jgi:hypothetical protein